MANNNDLGRYEITQNETDKFKFKVPSLRNLTSTAPYMHDGRFSNLNQVLDHYSTGIENHTYLDELIKKNKNAKIELSSMEKENLLAFLNTLNDETFLKDIRFAENSISENTEKKIDFSKNVVLFTNLDKLFLKNLDKNFSKYLVIKKSLTDQNSNLAAKYAEDYITQFNKIDTKNLTINQLSFFRSLKNEIIFNAEHIIEGREELEHQLDHFYEFSKDIYLLHASFKDVKNKKYFFYCTNINTKWLSNDRLDSTKFSGNNCKNVQLLEF